MTRPAVCALAEELYSALGATTAGDDEATGGSWLLLHLCQALMGPLQVLQDLAGDEDGVPAWSGLLDVDTAPAFALGFLGQLVGVELAPGLDDASQRLRIAGAAGWQRGTPAAITAAAQQWLTGTKHVEIVERHNDSAYQVRVTVLLVEAVDLEQLTRAVQDAIPAGIIATIDARPGWTFAQSFAAYPTQTFAQMAALYPTQSFQQFGGINP